MADNKYISLKVCGNQYANSGFMPLVSFNSPSFEVTDAEYSGFNTNSYFFSIRIERSQVVYTLIKNNVRSCNGALREGSLKIAIAIPKGYKIANGRTPYDALIQLKDSFISSCMTCKDPIKGVYEFNSGIINPNVLDDIAREFTLVNAPGPYHPMTVGAPKGYVILPEESMNLLFNDVQYVEFASYGEIVVAPSVQATNYTPIVNLQVPRKSRFTIIVDGVEDGYVENPDEEIPVRGKKDPKFYNNQQFIFTITDVRNGMINPNVVIDEERETVSINTASLSSPKSTKVRVVFPKEDEGYFYTFKKDFDLAYGNRVITLNDYTFELKGEDLGWLDNPTYFKATFKRNDEYRIKSCNIIKNALGEHQLIIAVEKVIKDTKTIVPEPRNTDLDVIKVDVLYKEPPFNKIVTLCLNTRKGYDTLLSTRVSGSRGVFYIPKAWNISTSELFVRYETSDDFYTSSIIHDRKSNTYIASGFEAQHKTFVDKKIKPNKTLIASFISILIGFILYGVIMNIIKPWIEEISEPDPVFTCKYCPTTFNNNDLLTEHINTEHLKHVCDTCSARFPTAEDLTTHINREHLTVVCNECTARFSNSEELTEHINSEHNIHKCNVCNARFDTEQKLSDHKNTHRSSESAVAKPFKCGSCNVSFDKRAQLEWHIKDKHNSVFKCRLCNLWFNNMRDLDNHMGSKHNRYECPHCGHDTYYDTRVGLNAHIRQKHPSDEI